MLIRFRIGNHLRTLVILVGLLAAGVLAAPLMQHPAAAGDGTMECIVDPTPDPTPTPVPTSTTLAEPGAFLALDAAAAPSPRCVYTSSNVGITVRIVNGRLVATFGNGRICTLVSVRAVTGTLNADNVTMEVVLDARGDGLLQADVTIACPGTRAVLTGLRITYDAQINQYTIDEGTFTPVREV